MISVIIPTRRSGEKLARTLAHLQPHSDTLEIIVVDTDDLADTTSFRTDFPCVHWLSAPPGRGPQQNAGALAATGDILLFLHSDTHLQDGWIAAVETAVTQPDFVLGAFQFKLDQPGWMFRGIEAGVALRNRLFQLPYGDQALFTTRSRYEQLGGFPDQALMEDVELIWQARRRGRITLLPLTATSSAERWQRDGIWTRTRINWWTYLRYKYRRPSLQALTSDYENQNGRLIIFAKRPEPGKVKTRLAASIGDDRAIKIYRQLVHHTLEQARASRAQIHLHYAPAAAEAEMQDWLGADLIFTAQPDGDLGDRMLAAFNQNQPTVIIGTDCPGLSAAIIDQAFDALNTHDLVLGPTQDGGYYLIGAKHPHPNLFQHDMPWSTDAVYSTTVQRMKLLKFTWVELPRLSDVDVEADLEYVNQAD